MLPEISQQVIFIIAAVNTLILLAIVFRLFFLNRKMKKILMPGSENIGESLSETKKHIANLHNFREDFMRYKENLEKRLGKSIQAVETLRFRAFDGIGSGGNQSFSTSFVNEQGDGIVVSGLYYSKDRVSIFTKPIKAFLSEHDLTDEEKEVIERAKKSLKN